MLPPAAALATVLLLAGCVPSDPIISPEPEPDTTPVFASDEEALAAATEAYAKYLSVSDEITADGGINADRISGLVTPSQFLNEGKGFKEFEDSNFRTRGSSTFDAAGLQQYVDAKDGTASVVVYVCVDVSAVDVVNESGEVVTPAGRRDRIPLEVEFEAKRRTFVDMTISRSEPWSGNDFCQQ